MNLDVEGWTVAKVAWGLLVSVAGWVGIRQVARIDSLEETRVEKKVHEDEITRVRTEHQRSIDDVKAALRDHRQEVATNFERIFDRLDTIADRIKG